MEGPGSCQGREVLFRVDFSDNLGSYLAAEKNCMQIGALGVELLRFLVP